MADEVETMAFHGETPWHGIGKQIDDQAKFSTPDMIEASGLNWDVELVPLVTADDMQSVPRFATRRTSDRAILGTVGERYEILQNTAAFNFFSPFVESREVAYETAISLRGGSRVAILAKLQRDNAIITNRPDDEIAKYLLLSHSHDGSLAVNVGFTPIRVVCMNTLRMALSSKASKILKLKHTKNVNRSLDQVRATVNTINAEFEATAEQYRILAKSNISAESLRKYVKIIFEVDGIADEEISTRTKNLMETVCDLAVSGRGNKGETYWDAYNGYTEWLNYHAGRNQDNRINSVMYGVGAADSDRALSVALELATV